MTTLAFLTSVSRSAAVVLATVSVLSSAGCGEQRMGVASEQPAKAGGGAKIDSSRLAGKTIFFQHESVGQNILDGIADLRAAGSAVDLVISKDTGATKGSGGLLIESRLGLNEDPIAKIDGFVRAVDGGIGGKANVAFLKLCYVDVTEKTDLQRLFGHYKNTMRLLKSKYPEIKFVHLTVPLRVNQETWKTRFKVATGMGQVWEYGDNLARGRYNDMIRREYAGKEPLFDLAAIEATRPDGTAQSFRLDGAQYESLVPTYSDDGGHLNADGRRMVASKLLEFVSSF